MVERLRKGSMIITPEELEGNPVSLWECANCGVEGIGTVYIEWTGIVYVMNATIACEEPEGWWLSSKTILCEECKPK